MLLDNTSTGKQFIPGMHDDVAGDISPFGPQICVTENGGTNHDSTTPLECFLASENVLVSDADRNY